MDEARARELLQRERDRVQRSIDELDRTRAEEDAGLDQHPADDAERLQGDDVDATLEDQLRADLEAIERAEERLATGTFGLSVESGEPIPDERLEAIPWAERTAGEQERFG
jgi:DnaK suppressor protein